MKYPQVKNLSLDAFAAHLEQLGIGLPLEPVAEPSGPLAASLAIPGIARRAPNRFAVLPMEGWDGTDDGRPTELVRRRWERFAMSGCGLVWGEATAVRRDGRANPHQLVIDRTTIDDLAALRGLLASEQIAGLQLTHSGRWSRPRGEPAPRTAYEHPLLDARAGATASSVWNDDELDELADDFVDAAVLAAEAGFDFVDVKHCHGYLLHELLSAYERPGRYGGDLEGRTNFLRTVVAGIRDRAPALAVAVRVSAFDLVPFVAGPDGTGTPEVTGSYRYAFGGDDSGLAPDLTETHALLDCFTELGIRLIGTTAGSPYYNPHVQRPAYFPPSDGYRPPEDPLLGVARHIDATAEIAARHPELVLVGAGYSYLQDWLPNVAQGVVRAGDVSMVGLGRMMLSYPTLAADVLNGRTLERRAICRTFSDCTTAPRNGLVSGCYPLDPFYKARPERVELARAKAATRRV
jgi:NADPH2 dehydrogenase